ncbi:hypothetical protein SOPEG_0801 [Candidatus Sodalis pierantonius str. SOPE]|uniref:Uncharacterized protein n=1 Tax=Candidatus Sodalis pierantonii str. SOPE TaxID=2342 RepID=W0HM36_9GAMM|nr:hypothetical protein [Candidatus Sodalis pierantonius]AHF73260.1 hypothetical protein SOPEG_0801 [Candidatus Sodalis pierantonius str. SOPE]
MGQVAFDTQEFVETLEKSGLKKEQAKAISLVVRKSHEVANIATKADINDVKRDISDVKHDIVDVRKDMDARFEKNEVQMQARFDKIEARFDKLGLQMTVRLGLMVAAGVSIIAAILKM